MSIENILSLLALRDRIVIVDFRNDGLYEGVVENVPRCYRDYTVTSIASAHDAMEHDYLWIEVL